MSGATKKKIGELIELRPGHARVTPDAGVTFPAPESSSVPGLSNVVPFLRPRVPEAAAAETTIPDVVLPADVARLPAQSWTRERIRHSAFVAASIALHGSIFAYFVLREPEPLASIGVEVISAEIVLGATAPAGIEQTPGEQQINAAAAATDPQQTEAQRDAEQKATEQPQNVEVAREETAPQQETMLERQADERTPQDSQAAPREQTAPADPKHAIAMVENPNTPDMATATPKEIPPDTTEVTLLPQPEEKPLEKKTEEYAVAAAPTKPQPKKEPKPAKQAAPPKPVKEAKTAPERRRIDAPTRAKAAKEAKASTPATAASNVGIGRSDLNTNYPGMVSAHLRRYQQYPSDARSRGDQGTATVSFGLDGGGRVTGARLVRGSGVASIDAEVQSMVRRASPFPAPPDGRPKSFTVPVSFRLN